MKNQIGQIITEFKDMIGHPYSVDAYIMCDDYEIQLVYQSMVLESKDFSESDAVKWVNENAPAAFGKSHTNSLSNMGFYNGHFESMWKMTDIINTILDRVLV